MEMRPVVRWVIGAGALVSSLVRPATGLAGDRAVLARALAGKLQAPAAAAASGLAAPRYFNAPGTALRCVALTAAEARFGGRHVFACTTTGGGEVLGGLLNRRGKPVCEPITGSFDPATECWSFQICGDTFEGCFPLS